MFTKNDSSSDDKAKRNMQAYRQGHLIGVFPPDTLLSSKQHKAVLEHIQNIVAIPTEHYALYYESLIDTFVNYAQVIPAGPNDYLCSLLNKSLSFAFLSLKEFKKAHSNTSTKLRGASEYTLPPLFTYALFSASLLHKIAAIMIHQRTVLTDKDGVFNKFWDPLQGPLTDETAYYKFYPIKGAYAYTEFDITLYLARQIMPPEGFSWISSNPDIFAQWVAILRNDLHFEGKMIEIFSFLKEKEREGVLELDLLPDMLIDQIDVPDMKHGEAFLAWLRTQIDDGKIQVNKERSGVYQVGDIVLVEFEGMLREFKDIYGWEGPMNVVFTQFCNMFGITKKSGYDFAYDMFSFDDFFETLPGMEAATMNTSFISGMARKTAQTTKQGLIVADKYLLLNPETMGPPTDKISLKDASTQGTAALPPLQKNDTTARLSFTTPKPERK